MSLLADPDAEIRASAASAIAEIGPGAAAAVPALTRMLDDPDRNARWNAVRALAQMGSWARSAGPALLRLRADRSSWPPGPLLDRLIDEHLEAAVEATGANEDPALLAEEEQIHVAVISQAVEDWRKGKPSVDAVALTVTGHPASESLLRSLSALGVRFDTGRYAHGRKVAIEEITFIRPTYAALTLTVWEQYSGWGRRYFLRLVGGTWKVIGSAPGAIYN